MVILIDNYDSFSYNLYQMVGMLLQEKHLPAVKEPVGAGWDDADMRFCEEAEELLVVRNDAMTVEEIRKLSPDRIILSPGPGKPADAGICEGVVRQLGPEIPILGVCLGHQAICEVYGSTVSHAGRLMHGKQSVCRIEADSVLFRGVGEPAGDMHAKADAKAEITGDMHAKANANPGTAGECPGRCMKVARYHSLSLKESTLTEELVVTARAVDDGEVMAVQHRTYPVYGLQFHPESILTPEGEKILRNFLFTGQT